MRIPPVLFAALVLIPVAAAFARSAGGSAARPSGSAAAPATSAAAPAGLLDINTASRDALMACKGIGPAYADNIIKGRPYARKNQLLIKRVVPKKVYDAIKNRITVKP